MNVKLAQHEFLVLIKQYHAKPIFWPYMSQRIVNPRKGYPRYEIYHSNWMHAKIAIKNNELITLWWNDLHKKWEFNS